MKIVLVNWARIWDGAGFGGGVNGYCQSLALELVARGHEVVSMFGGMTFVPAAMTPRGDETPFVRRHEDWLGVKVFEVISSTVMAPSIVQYQRPMDEVSAPELEREVERLFGLLRPDVVHFHNVEGFSIGCVEAAKRSGARTLFSLHNYHTICPQVYLMQGHRRVCHDSRRGHNCVNCISTKDPGVERRERAEAYVPPVPAAMMPTTAMKGGDRAAAARSESQRLEEEYRRAVGGLKHEFSWPVRVVKKVLELRRLRREIESARRVGIEGGTVWGVETQEDVRCARPVVAASGGVKKARSTAGSVQADPRLELLAEYRNDDQRGQTQAIMLEWDRLAKLDVRAGQDGGGWNGNVRVGNSHHRVEREPLLNVIQPEPACEVDPNEYGERRRAMVRMLSSCDRVLAVSRFVRDKFVSMGVDPGVIEVLPIGSRIGQVVEQGQEMVFDPPAFPEAGDPVYAAAPDRVRPVRLVFMGYNNYYKGLHVLAEALGVLTPEYLRRLDVSIYALDGHSIEWVFRRMEPRLAKLTFVHGYSYHDIPWMLGGKDLGVVPSVWWDNAPQTVFECYGCGVPVLGAAVGGIPDFVIDGHNGMLFRGNDSWDLARRLAEAVREPWRLTELRRNVVRPKGMGEHAKELEGLYQVRAS